MSPRNTAKKELFGDKPLGSYHGVQYPLADVAIRLQALKEQVYKAARMVDAGESSAQIAQTTQPRSVR